MPDKKSFLLRLDAKLFEELKRWAGAELRSVNGQVEFILRQAVRKRHGQDARRTRIQRRRLPARERSSSWADHSR